MVENPQIVWNRCMEFFHDNLNEQQYRTWFVPTKFKSYNENEGMVVIYVPSQFFYEYLEANYRRLLHSALYRFFAHGTKLAYEVEVVQDVICKQKPYDKPEIGPAKAEGKANVAPTPVQELDSHLNVEQNFDNFIEGTSNKMPRSIGQAIAEHPDQKTFNPLFVFGPSGVGKTHLLNAIGTRIKQLYPQKRVLYLSAHLFQVQYTDSVRRNTFNDFMHFYQSIDVLIMDDIQEMIGKDGTQYAFFHIFNHLHQNGRQIILACDRPPTMLMGMEDRLITRFKWGLLAEIERPGEVLRRDILVDKIRHDGLSIPSDVVDYISERVCDSVRELEGVVHSLLAYSVVYNKEMNLSFAKCILDKGVSIEPREITIEQIVDDTCACCNVRQEDVFGKSRKAHIVQARQLSIYLAQKHTKLTHSKIGALVGNRNHATVIHSIRTIENRLQVDKSLQDILQEIEYKLSARK